MKVRKIALPVLIIFTLVIILYFSICLSFFVSDNYTVFEGASIENSLPFGIYADESVVVSDSGALSGTRIVNENQTRKATIKVLNVIPVKEVSVNSIQNVLLYPSGECIGIKMYSKGIVVVGFSDFETSDGVCVSPGAVAGLRKGDIIESINGKSTSSVREITNSADASNGDCVLGVKRAFEFECILGASGKSGALHRWTYENGDICEKFCGRGRDNDICYKRRDGLCCFGTWNYRFGYRGNDSHAKCHSLQFGNSKHKKRTKRPARRNGRGNR